MSIISITTNNPKLEAAARIIAARVGLPFGLIADYHLVLTESGLELATTKEKLLPVKVDFSSPELFYRRTHSGGKGSPLGKALGIKTADRPSVFDATAGLGSDALMMATLGCEVMMCERSPIIHALLEDGLARANADPALAEIMSRMRLVKGNSSELLASGAYTPDVVYLDPMFPEKTKKALPPKEMRIFRDLVGDDMDAATLLAAARAAARKRVVVKRPRLASAIEGIAPSHVISGKVCRYDVYTT